MSCRFRELLSVRHTFYGNRAELCGRNLGQGAAKGTDRGTSGANNYYIAKMGGGSKGHGGVVLVAVLPGGSSGRGGSAGDGVQ